MTAQFAVRSGGLNRAAPAVRQHRDRGLSPSEAAKPVGRTYLVMMPQSWHDDARTYLATRVDAASPQGCWISRLKLDRDGYARCTFKRQRYAMHRLAYEAYVARIPDGLQIDHLCRNRACCNPAHLEPVSNWENTRRSTNPMALRAAQTHCKRGHEFTPENTRRRGAARECKRCKADGQRLRNARRRTGEAVA